MYKTARVPRRCELLSNELKNCISCFFRRHSGIDLGAGDGFVTEEGGYGVYVCSGFEE